MLRLASQKRRLKSKVQELSDDDIIREVEPRTAASPSCAHDEPTIPFVGRIDSWKLPPPPRLPVLASFLARSTSNSSPSSSSVPPVAIPAAKRSPARKLATLASGTVTQKFRAALGEVTENTLLIVQGRPSVAWAAGLLAIGMCFGAFLARPGRNEGGREGGREGGHEVAAAQITQESAAPEIVMAAPPTRAPTVSEVAVPVMIVAAPPAPAAPVPIAPAKVVAPKKPLAKKGAAATEPSARTATREVTVADALAREQLKSTLR